jgi:bacterioferritin
VTDNSFGIDVAAIRDRARQKMGRGPVTEYYGTDPDKVVGILNEVLATEIVCWMRPSRHAIPATGINRAPVSVEFTGVTTRRLLEDILAEEEEHADDILDLLGLDEA